MIKEAVFVADRHTGIESQSCDRILKNYLDNNGGSISYFIDLGDGIDNPFMSDYAVDPKFILSAQEEFDMYAKHLKEIQDIIPRAKKFIIAGNHDKGRLEDKKQLNRGIASLRNIQYENVLKEALKKAGVKGNKYEMVDGSKEIELANGQTVLITHGDPRLDPYVKGGVTGTRRTAEMYPTAGDIIMGHRHDYQEYPRRFTGKRCIVLDGMFDIDKMKDLYVNTHPYTNGFGIMRYNNRTGETFWEHVEIKNGKAIINGRTYNG